MREREMLKVTKCIGVKSFVEALINMACELKITAGSTKNCVKVLWISDISLKSYLPKKNRVTRPMKYIVEGN